MLDSAKPILASRATSLCDLPRWRVRKRQQMPLDPAILGSAVRITSFGDLCGTGFIMTVPSESIPGKRWGYVLTAHHVIKGQVGVEIEVPNPFDLATLQAPITVENWTQPLDGVDLAVAPISTEFGRKFAATGIENALPAGDVPLLGTPIHYVGIFAPIEGPMVRSGTLGGLDHKIVEDRDGTRYDYPAHLVDCRSYEGFSGSPCFSQVPFAVTNQPPYLKREPEPDDSGVTPDPIPIWYETLFAGMLSAHFTDRMAEEGSAGVASSYGVGVMIRTDEILEALMSDKAKAERADRDRRHVKAAESEGPTVRGLGIRRDDPGDRDRASVISDFEKAAGPLRGHNRDPKPKA